MKIMNQAIQMLTLGLILVCSISLNAQPGQARGKGDARPQLTPEERAQKMTDRQKENLGLSDEQYKKVLEINKNHALKYEAQRAEAQKARETRQATAQEIEASRETELRKVLTDEQFARFQQNKQQMRDKAQERKTQGPPPHRGRGPQRG